jgi:transposase
MLPLLRLGETVEAGRGHHRAALAGRDQTSIAALEVVPRRWKVIQTVREKFSCRNCETITQPPAPFHVTPRGFAGANLLAMILFEKFGQHQPLNRQSERYAREGIDLSVSTLADQIGACTAALQPLHALVETHVLAAERLHGDDTTVPILAKGKTGHIWTYVRDDRPFGGTAPPAALYYASRDRKQEHPVRHLQSYTGILQADAYSGYNGLYDPSRQQGAIMPALCWAHARRKFFELADIAANARRGKKLAAISPIALEAVKRIDALFDMCAQKSLPRPHRGGRRLPCRGKIIGQPCQVRKSIMGIGARHRIEPLPACFDTLKRSFPSLLELCGDKAIVRVAGGVAALGQ